MGGVLLSIPTDGGPHDHGGKSQLRHSSGCIFLPQEPRGRGPALGEEQAHAGLGGQIYNTLTPQSLERLAGPVNPEPGEGSELAASLMHLRAYRPPVSTSWAKAPRVLWHTRCPSQWQDVTLSGITSRDTETTWDLSLPHTKFLGCQIWGTNSTEFYCCCKKWKDFKSMARHKFSSRVSERRTRRPMLRSQVPTAD